MPEPTTPEPAATAEPAPTRRTRAATSEPEPTKPAPAKAEPPATRPARPATAEPATPATGEHPPTAKPRRRQARGERRIAQLLDAAASVFCTSGYTAASTNAIAREAGVSPGTLYQFFPNKEAIAVELGGRLLERWRDSHGAALTAANLDLPLDQLLDAVLDPLFAFNHENPAFAVLVHGPDVPGQITQEFDALHAVLLTRIEEIVASFLPDAPPAELSLIATMIFAIFKAGLDLVLAHEGEERQAYIDEIKKVLFRYLAPIVGFCPAGQPAAEQRDAQPGAHSH
ncbi:TetR family transcriptional regulator [Streptomyces sp. NBC_01481]|uniref:TetR family transcriptional regulator n=1 Tax=Streptomyces sp. NBC_01481 TaxID=2975869 RepID=UPI002252F261|nr:TetR family transcriptional regulator [Streptomyces sp. NBC_01481]MCX4582051.1 TetR family transcriptional regulator [Streptomyces sp. NBC_01481]